LSKINKLNLDLKSVKISYMIAYLKGKILAKTSKSTILLVGEVGYEIFLSPKALKKVSEDQQLEFFIHNHVKEDAFDLYGFKTLEELDFFRKLISVSGVGPKTALNVLAIAEVEELKRAISSENASFLQQVSGIGKKTAERLVVDLKEKFIIDLTADATISGSDRQVVEALISLGYKEKEAYDIIKGTAKTGGDLASRIKSALKAVNSK
jgi:Holliday junction DNA helicase RuvA